MKWHFTPDEWMLTLALGGIACMALTYIPSIIAAKIRRIKRKKTHRTCRLCGYRFILRDPEARCPQCGARNQ